MSPLFVDKTITIHAPASHVWSALTDYTATKVWAQEFSSGGPRFHIESDWEFGSLVLWKGDDGKTIVEGSVTALEPLRLLRFTVFDVRSERPAVTEKDGITFELTEHDGKTKLHVLQGDFSSIKDGAKYRDMSAVIWDRVLPHIKAIAEK